MQSRQITPIHEAPETRLRRGTSLIGMTVFIASWAMLFGALFFGYGLLRSRAVTWPPPGVAPLPLILPSINTALIILSSVAMHLGIKRLKSTAPQGYLRWLAAALGLGLIFMVLQLVVWTRLWSGGFQVATGTYGSVFYLMTVFHALHVVVGLGMMAALVPAAWRRSSLLQRQSRAHLVSVFWHFVGLLWIVLFVLVYLI